jgi:hypothetical protein
MQKRRESSSTRKVEPECTGKMMIMRVCFQMEKLYEPDSSTSTEIEVPPY